MKKLIFLFPVLVFISCEMTADVNMDIEPNLQVDAVFYSGQTMPEITIRRTFDTSGPPIYEVRKDDLLVSDATVTLLHNGKSVNVSLTSPGKYQPDSDAILAQGDRIEIHVSSRNRTVSAIALIPDFPVDEIRFTPPDRVLLLESMRQKFYHDSENDHTVWEIDTVWVAMYQIDVEIPFKPDFTAFKMYSVYEVEVVSFLSQNPNNMIDGINYRARGPRHSGGESMFMEFHHLFGENYSNQEYMSHQQGSILKFEHDEKPTGTISIDFQGEIVIPEPIYYQFKRTESSAFTPVTVSNVKGGVGLFIGAIRHDLDVTLEVFIE